MEIDRLQNIAESQGWSEDLRSALRGQMRATQRALSPQVTQHVSNFTTRLAGQRTLREGRTDWTQHVQQINNLGNTRTVPSAASAEAPSSLHVPDSGARMIPAMSADLAALANRAPVRELAMSPGWKRDVVEGVAVGLTTAGVSISTHLLQKVMRGHIPFLGS